MGYETCRNGCGTLLTDEYANARGLTCPDCRRSLGSKIWYTFYGPGSVARS